MKDIYKIPNLLSIFRIILVFPIAYLMYFDLQNNRTLIIILIIISGLSDISDGVIARKFNMITELGKIIDPIADKLSVFTFAIIIVLKGMFPLWLFVVIAARDIAIVFAGIYLKRKDKVILMSNYPGKLAALSMGLIILFSIINIELLNTINSFLYYVTLVLIVYSTYIYLTRFIKIVRQKNG